MQSNIYPSAPPNPYVQVYYDQPTSGETKFPTKLSDIAYWRHKDGTDYNGDYIPHEPYEIKYWVDRLNQMHKLPSGEQLIYWDLHGNINFRPRNHMSRQPLHTSVLHGHSTHFLSPYEYSTFHSGGNYPHSSVEFSRCEPYAGFQNVPIQYRSLPVKPLLTFDIKEPEEEQQASIGIPRKPNQKILSGEIHELLIEVNCETLNRANIDNNDLSLLIGLLQLTRDEMQNRCINICPIEVIGFFKLMQSSVYHNTIKELNWNLQLIEKCNELMKLSSVKEIANDLVTEGIDYKSPILDKLIQFEEVLHNQFTLESVFALLNLYNLKINPAASRFLLNNFLTLLRFKGFAIIPAIEVLNQLKLFEVKYPATNHQKNYSGVCAKYSKCDKAKLIPLSKVFLTYFKDCGFNQFGHVTCDQEKNDRVHEWNKIFEFNKLTGETKFSIVDKMLISHCFKHSVDLCWFCLVASHAKLSGQMQTETAQNNCMSQLTKQLIQDDEHNKAVMETHRQARDKARKIEYPRLEDEIFSQPFNSIIKSSENTKIHATDDQLEYQRIIADEKQRALLKQRRIEQGYKESSTSKRLKQEEPLPSISDSDSEEWGTPPCSPRSQAFSKEMNSPVKETTSYINKVKTESAITANEEGEGIAEEIDEEKIISECSVCLEKFDRTKWRIILIPCGHARFCQKCVESFKKITNQNPKPICPFCRDVFTGDYKVFL